MSDQNPYAAPQSHISAPQLPPGEFAYASRLSRLGAAFLDGIILAPLNFLISWFLAPKVDDAWAAEVMRTKGFEEGMKQVMAASTPSLPVHLLMIVLLLGSFIGINWVFLKNGQTIGKKAAKIQIQKRTGGLLTVKDLILKRMLPVQLAVAGFALISPSLTIVGMLIAVVDVLCIFRSGYNTIHDDIAQSKVVKL